MNAAVVSPAGALNHCVSRNRSGMRSSVCGVLSISTGKINLWSGAMKCDRSTASFHSRRKYPSTRACALAETTAMKSAHCLIWRRIAASQASPPRSSLWSNQTSIPAARRLAQMREAAAVSPEA